MVETRDDELKAKAALAAASAGSKFPGAGGTSGGGGRLFSLDVYRGLVMTLLVAEGARVYETLHELDVPWARPIAKQFMHAPWSGLTFWDLVQPAFMFIVGVSMVFSMRKRAERGDSKAARFGHILKRCVILFLLGTGLHCLYAGALVFELWNVLTQLSVTILIAYAIMEWPVTAQLLVSLVLIGATDAAYRFAGVEGYSQPFVPGENLGTYIDTLLMGKVNSDHWVVVNFIPSAAHTIWGVLAGKLLIGGGGKLKKTAILALFGVIGIAIGYGLDYAGYAPIIKRTCTGPFVIVSGGWCVLALALFYGAIDGLGIKGGGWIVAAVGMNSILIYMITESMAWSWVYPKVGIFVEGGLGMIGVEERAAAFINALVVWWLLWALCWWLYRKRAFVKV
jgi:predicted acyltransferase